jgi:hypothetical protein
LGRLKGDGSFDPTRLAHVGTGIEGRPEFLAEISRVQKPGGGGGRLQRP